MYNCLLCHTPRSHICNIYLSVYLSHPSVYLSLSSIFYLSLSSIHLSLYLSIYLSIYVSIYCLLPRQLTLCLSLTTQGQTRCEDCPRDTYQGQTAASSCSLCPQRHQHATQHTGAVSVTQCECGGGHEMPQRALPGDNCTQCAAGFEKPLPGTQPCTPCDLGTYSPSPAHATCLLCPPGRSRSLIALFIGLF